MAIKQYKNLIVYCINACIFISLITIAAHNVVMKDFLQNLSTIHIWDVIFCIVFFGISCFFRALMWFVTTRNIGHVGISALFGGVVVGYMANNIFPLRLGEFVRAYFLTLHSSISFTSSVSTILIERFFDILCIFFLMIITTFLGLRVIIDKGHILQELLITFIAAGLIFCIIVIWNSFRKKNNKTGKVIHLVEQFILPLRALKSFYNITILILMSIAAWCCNYFALWVFIYRLIDNHLEAGLVLFLFASIGVLIPSSPGALGVMQIAFWLALMPYGIQKEQALALSFAYQGGIYFFTITVGMFYVLKSRKSLGKMIRNVIELRKSINIRGKQDS